MASPPTSWIVDDVKEFRAGDCRVQETTKVLDHLINKKPWIFSSSYFARRELYLSWENVVVIVERQSERIEASFLSCI